MDRIIIGKSPDTESSFSDTNARAGKTGLFISKPGANVMSCSDGDLLFDSTAPDFMQVLAKGTAFIPKGTILSSGITKPTIETIETNIKVPYEEENATVLVRWNEVIPASNVHPTAFSSSWGTGASEGYVTIPPYLNLDNLNLGNPANTGTSLGYSLTAKTSTKPINILPQTPVSLPFVGTDGRTDPSLNYWATQTTGTTRIAWCNTTHVFTTKTTGEYVATINKYLGSAFSPESTNNRKPTWIMKPPGNPIAWSATLSGADSDASYLVYNSLSTPATQTRLIDQHTTLHPSFTTRPGPGAQNLGKRLIFAKSGHNQTIVASNLPDEYLGSSKMEYRANHLVMSDDFGAAESVQDLSTIWTAHPTESISDVQCGPLTDDGAVYGGRSYREYGVAFVVKDAENNGPGKIMVIDYFEGPTRYARQISPSYLDCSGPAWSPNTAGGPGPHGSKISFIADAGTSERRVCIIDSGTFWGTDDNELPNGPIHNPYSLVELTETKANSATWANATHILSDYNGGSYTDVSTLTPASDTIDIVFSNGSLYKDHFIAWTLYRAKGI
jgi:hypothetical protein